MYRSIQCLSSISLYWLYLLCLVDLNQCTESGARSSAWYDLHLSTRVEELGQSIYEFVDFRILIPTFDFLINDVYYFPLESNYDNK